MTAPRWRWIKVSSALAIHEEQISEHGGVAGTRDASLLSSALARPQNLEAYGTADIADLAAAYAVGIARNHPFIDGNKRTAWVVMEIFLLKNGYELIATDRDGVTTMLSTADGSLSEQQLALWIRTNIRPLPR